MTLIGTTVERQPRGREPVRRRRDRRRVGRVAVADASRVTGTPPPRLRQPDASPRAAASSSTAAARSPCPGQLDHANTSSLANSIPTPYPEQDGATDQENAKPAECSCRTARPRPSATRPRSATPFRSTRRSGRRFGADAALCACGDVPLTIANSRIDGNTLTVNAFSSDANGPSGPAAFEADANATITNTRICRQHGHDDGATGDAAAIGAVGFFFGGTVTPTMTDRRSSTTGRSRTAAGTATVQGAGISNNGPLVLTHDRVSGNTASANGQSGFAQGAGIWNGLLFGGPTSPLTSRTRRHGQPLTGERRRSLCAAPGSTRSASQSHSPTASWPSTARPVRWLLRQPQHRDVNTCDAPRPRPGARSLRTPYSVFAGPWTCS